MGSSPGQYVIINAELPEEDAEISILFRQILVVDEANVKQSSKPKEDQRALDISHNTTIRIDGLWEAMLLWRSDEPSLLNNYNMAVRVMEALGCKLAKDEEQQKKVQGLSEEYLAKNKLIE